MAKFSIAVACALAALLSARADEPAPAASHPESLPAPTGPHKIGRASFHCQDAQRSELETSAPDDVRELMVHLFYPADPSATGELAVYVPDVDDMREVWNDEQRARIKRMPTRCIEDAMPLQGNSLLPVAIFAPGGGMKALTYHALLEDLASHGWVVAAIDPPYNARAVRFPDGRVLGGLRPDQRGWTEPKNSDEFERNYIARIGHWARDVSFVIDQLNALNQTGRFAQRFDLERGVGVLGHSRGGHAAGAARLVDDRVRGGVNLDGTAGPYAIMPIKGKDVAGSQPFLWIQKSLGPGPTDDQLKRAGRSRAEYDALVAGIVSGWHRGLESITGGALRVTFERPDLDHIDFSDERFWDGSQNDENRAGRLKTIADTRHWVRAFFNGAVRGDWADLKPLVGNNEKEDAIRTDVTVRSFGKLWP